MIRTEIEWDIESEVGTRVLADRMSQGRYLGGHVKGSEIADRIPVSYATNMNASVVSSFGKSDDHTVRMTQNLVIFPSRHSELEDGGLLGGLAAENCLVGHLA